MSKYTEYMLETFPQGLYEQWNKCKEFCAKMHRDFPELILKTGYVYSYKNIDNYGDLHKQYPHVWLETKEGEIVDPTVKQFGLLGELHYVDSKGKPFRGSCNGCGQLLFTDHPKYDAEGLICGKCKWTSPATQRESSSV